MIKITFNNPQTFDEGLIGGFTCMHVFAESIRRNPKEPICVIRLEDYKDNPNAIVFMSTANNNIKSIEHVKPTDL